MARHYVTFGQVHVHYVNGHTLDKDSVASYEANDYAEGREKAFELFKGNFFTDYHDLDFNTDSLHYFPRGIIDIDFEVGVAVDKK